MSDQRKKAPSPAPVGKKPPQRRKKKSAKKRGGFLNSLLNSVKRLFSAFYHLFDLFRINDVMSVLVDAALGGIAVVIILCVVMALKPGYDSRRARNAAEDGDVTRAVSLLRQLERNQYPDDKLDDTRVDVVSGFIDAGKLDEALTLIPDIQDPAARAEMEKRCGYARAEAEYKAGKYSEAAQRFYQLGDYADSAARYDECRCALAIEAYISGDEAAARSMLLDVKDVVKHVRSAAVQVAGGETEAAVILSADIFNADALAQMEATMTGLKEARSTMPQGRIAAGSRHSVGLRADGTVIAAGDDSKGQCAVAGWTGITQVATGAYHTVGLRADGTCVATGDNSCGQTEVTGWSHIVAIAAGSYSTIGLKADGTVVACGLHAEKVTGWRDVTAVTAGSYSMGCVYGSGMMMSSHRGAQLNMGAVLYDLSICGQVSAGVLYDGAVVSSYAGAPQWTGMAAVTVCESGMLGIDAAGGVRSFFYRPGDALDMTVPGAAVEIESSGTHHLVLTEDGKVYAFGNNDYGQCNLFDWQL